MSKEAISRVLAAETEADAIRARAQAEARERVSACETAEATASADAIAQTTVELKARGSKIRERADALIAQSREEASTDIETLRAAAKDKMREAVKHIEWELCDV